MTFEVYNSSISFGAGICEDIYIVNLLMSSRRVSHLSFKSVSSGSSYEAFRCHTSCNRILALIVTGVAHPNGS